MGSALVTIDKPVFDVLVCGSLHLDIVVHTQRLPQIDETASGSGWEQVCGGKGGNQAVQAARHGAKTAMIGRIGRDAFGETLLQNLNDVGVEARCVEVDSSAGSGMSVAILQANGEYGAVFVSGANAKIDPLKLNNEWQDLSGARVLVLQNEVPEAVNLAVARLARETGAKVVFNAAPARSLPEDFRKLVDVLVVNRVEAQALTGIAVNNRASARLALPKLAGEKGAVVITLGGQGVVVQDGDNETIEIEALTVTVTSAHGAGDCFVGVLAAELAAGACLIQACIVANRKAAEFVSRPRHEI